MIVSLVSDDLVLPTTLSNVILSFRLDYFFDIICKFQRILMFLLFVGIIYVKYCHDLLCLLKSLLVTNYKYGPTFSRIQYTSLTLSGSLMSFHINIFILFIPKTQPHYAYLLPLLPHEKNNEPTFTHKLNRINFPFYFRRTHTLFGTLINLSEIESRLPGIERNSLPVLSLSHILRPTFNIFY